MLHSLVLPGLDALQAGRNPELLAFLAGRKLGLLTNHTGRTRDGASTLAALRKLGLDVRALFSPEHGIEGQREGHIASGQTADALPIHSLYGETRRPTPAMLEGIAVLVCDLQDVGARFYTYASTLAHCLEECALSNVAVVVLDRPNPLGGEVIEGPGMDGDQRSFVGYLDVPIQHGLTLGELAQLFQHDAHLAVELKIARVLHWQREMSWPETGLEWPIPSPNLPDFQSALWYPGVCLLEFSDLSVGRGTDAPFQIIGAPWLDAARVLHALQDEPAFARHFNAATITFTPTRGEHAGALCHGLRFGIQRSAVSGQHSAFGDQRSVPLGLTLLSTLHRVQPEAFGAEKLRAALQLLGSSEVLARLQQGNVAAAIELAERNAAQFRARREPFLLY